MIPVATDGTSRYDANSRARRVRESTVAEDAPRTDYSAVAALSEFADLPPLDRTLPRRSVVLVLPESRSISPELLVDGLRVRGYQHVDVVVACAGQPGDLSALQRCVGDAQFLLAPAGTSAEDLREMAMAQAAGDIVTLMTAPLIGETALADQPLVRAAE